jgi:pyridoxal phosphate enzyme (YggS family)
MNNSILTNLKSQLERIDLYQKKYQQAHPIQLLAVTKGQPIAKIEEALAAGQKCFGENYCQEALLKIQALKFAPLEWHFIGHIQSNKIKKIAENFSWVQTVTSEQMAEKLNQYRPESLGPMNICIEVNIDEEGNKSGVRPDEVVPLAEYIRGFPLLRLRGLMAIPSPKKNFYDQRQSFHKMAKLFKMLPEVDTLSMGMSQDFEAAIAEGSTLVRLGTAIFGSRS